jgi:hypothetical protein
MAYPDGLQHTDKAGKVGDAGVERRHGRLEKREGTAEGRDAISVGRCAGRAGQRRHRGDGRRLRLQNWPSGGCLPRPRDT